MTTGRGIEDKLRKYLNKLLFGTHILLSRFFPVRIKILMAHQVGGKEKSTFNISIQSFESLLINLKNRKVISLSSLNLDDPKSTEVRWALTFDDVPESFYENAYPLLKKYDMPFTLFVATSLLNTDGYINETQLKEMADDSLCTIGSHGVSHSYMCFLSKIDFEKELRESQRILSDMIGKEITLFAFPYGSYYACGYTNKKKVDKYYDYGFSTIPTGIAKMIFTKKYFLPRINVSEKYIDRIAN